MGTAQKTVTLVTGGGRSGKSQYALERARRYPRRVFVATAEPCDDEMKDRIARHRAGRDASFVTVEEPRDLAKAVQSLPPDMDVALVDCVTVWLGNLFHRHGGASESFPEVDQFLLLAARPPCHLILVANEVGMGIIPETELGRRFRDMAGFLNQKLAHLADEVVFLVSGIPMVIKKGK
mgnify:CR=1 FL=1